MSAAKHTPGPWELRASNTKVDFGIIVADPKAESGWAVIAEAFSEIRFAGERAPEALPNARLMAAAPRLFDALENLTEAITTGAGRDFIEAFVRDASAALEEAQPGWNKLDEPTAYDLRAKGRVRAAAPDLLEVCRLFAAYQAAIDSDDPAVARPLEAYSTAMDACYAAIAKAGGAA